MAKLLGIDIGTSGCKVLLVDETGRVLKQASAEYPLSVPRPTWSEQNPEDWWAGVQGCLADIGEEKPDAIGLTGQMHGAVFLDASLEVVRPAILWNDQRTVEECEEIDRAVGRDRLMEITCNPPLTGFQLPKILWLRNHELSNYHRTRHVLLPKDYIRLKLTGELASEVSDASGTGLLDVPSRAWSSELMDVLEIEPSLLPECAESFTVTSKTAGGIPVVGGGGDQAAAAVGTGAVEEGVISVSLGTSGVVFTSLPSPKYDAKGAAHTFCHANGGWHAMGVMLSCGGALRWYRDTLAQGMAYDRIAAEAETSEPGADGLTFLPYLTGERCPHNDPFARAAFAGMTLGHRHADLSRAVFEGISFGLLDCMNLVRDLGATADDIRVTSGGSKSRLWLQMLADLFDAPCTTLEVDEGPAFGAAILAGVGIGIWPNVKSACKQVVKPKATTRPQGKDYAKAYARYRALYAATKPWNLL
ncbi:MAG TPA: xylulokinase [Fimbriimonadaceae bacterium]|nr:xylulokinase [Fimbriimonadaceae bacterium]